MKLPKASIKNKPKPSANKKSLPVVPPEIKKPEEVVPPKPAVPFENLSGRYPDLLV